jgi:protein TonB
MKAGAARRRLRVFLSRRAVLAGSLATLLLCFVALVFLLRRPAPPPAAPKKQESGATVTVAEAPVRQQPDAASATTATLSRGARVEVVRDLGLWMEIRGKDAAGFLPAEALERDSDREARARRAGTVLSFTPVSGVVVEDTPLRLAPFPMAPRAGALSKGTTVRIYSVDHAYYALKGPDGGLAFVDSASVDVIPPDPRRPAIVPSRERALKNLEVAELSEPPSPEPGEEPFEAPPAPPPQDGEPVVSPVPAAPPLVPAALLTKVDPAYPEMARRAGAEGTVVLEATIGEDGRVRHVEVVRGLPFGLSQAAVAAVKLWRYRPARGPSGPVASRKEVRIEFRLRS